MTTRVDYSADEWKVLTDSFLIVGMGVSRSDRTGPVSAVREFTALVTAAMDVANELAHNELIQDVLDDRKPKAGEGETSGAPEGQFPLEQVFEFCTLVADILDTRSTPQEAAEFKNWLIAVGEAVAGAAGDGLFGRGGNKINDQEAEALAGIRAALRA